MLRAGKSILATGIAVNPHNSMIVFKRNVSRLVMDKSFINGSWVKAKSNKQFDVLNPANLSVVGSVPDMTAVDTTEAIDCAYQTFHSAEWQTLTAKERSGLLKVSQCVDSPSVMWYTYTFHPLHVTEMVQSPRGEQTGAGQDNDS